jgi:tetratricopeptide (TPR) repeat protein
MIIDALAWAGLVLSFGMLTVLAVRKIPLLRAIDVETIAKERHARVKKDLIAQRLRRKILFGMSWMQDQTKPLLEQAQEGLKRLVEKVENMEREYRHRSHASRPLAKLEEDTRIPALLEEAATLRKAEEYEKAEQKYIEAISMAPQSIEAFQGLGELYLEQKEYEHAKESLQYALKLSPKNTALLLDLADIHTALSDHAAALSCCQQAVAIEPNDPKTLHALLQASIVMQERDLAERTLQQLEAANPENQKLAELRELVAALPPLNDTITKK